MPGSKNAVERKLAEVENLWLDASDDDDARLFIWRTAADSDRLIQVFFALQQEGQNDYTTPDLFVHFTTPFETSYGYSHALEQEFTERVNISSFPESRWSSDGRVPCYRGETLFSLLNDFAHYHQGSFRYLAVILTPAAISHSDSFHRFLDELCCAGTAVPSYLRFMLVDTLENPTWQGLAARFPETVRILTPVISEDELMRQTLNETPTSDGSAMLRFRQVMVDSFISLKNGTAAQTEHLAQKAVVLARQQGWTEQQVIMLSMIAGAWLKEQQAQRAAYHYRLAVQEGGSLPAESRHILKTQNLMGEGNAWFMNQAYLKSSSSYYNAALEAQKVPSPLLAMEGYRMAGFSLMSVTPLPEDITQHYYDAFLTGLSMSELDRNQSGFMQIFRDLLNFLAPDATARCDRLASHYRSQLEKLVCQAEMQVDQSSLLNINSVVAESDNMLMQHSEELFHWTIVQREHFLLKESDLYQDVLSLARKYSYDFWSPGTEILHPDDKPVGDVAIPNFEYKKQTCLTEPDNYLLFKKVFM
jgi:hypothetical protein